MQLNTYFGKLRFHSYFKHKLYILSEDFGSVELGFYYKLMRIRKNIDFKELNSESNILKDVEMKLDVNKLIYVSNQKLFKKFSV